MVANLTCDVQGACAGVEGFCVSGLEEKTVGGKGDNPAESRTVVELCREMFGLAQMIERSLNLTQWCQGVSQLNSQIDGYACPFRIRQVIGSDKRVFQMLRGDLICRAGNCSCRRGLEVDDCAVPDLGPKSMECQPIGFLGYLVGIELFPGNQRGGVQFPTSFR